MTVPNPPGRPWITSHEFAAGTMDINVTSLKLAGGWSPENELLLYANPGQNFEIEVTVSYKTAETMKLASNIGPDKELLSQTARELGEKNHSWTWHFDTESRLGYHSAQGEEEITFNLISWAPEEKGRYPMTLQVGLFTKGNWATKLDKRYPIVLVNDPALLTLAEGAAPPVPFDELNAFFKLVQEDDIQGVKVAIDENPVVAVAKGHPESAASQSAIFYAQSVNMANLLTENGASWDVVNIFEQGPLSTVGEKLQVHLVEKGLIDADLTSLLGIACAEGRLQLANMLVERGADVNGKEGNMDPLLAAILRGQDEMRDFLFERGAKVKGGESGNKFITFLAYNMRPEEFAQAVAMLLENGLDPEMRDQEDISWIPWSLLVNKLDSLKLFVDAGADVNAKTEKGQTAIYYAIRQNKPDAVKLLVQAGTDLKTVCGESLTPSQLAEREGRPELAALLVSAGGNETRNGKQDAMPESVAPNATNGAASAKKPAHEMAVYSERSFGEMNDGTPYRRQPDIEFSAEEGAVVSAAADGKMNEAKSLLSTDPELVNAYAKVEGKAEAVTPLSIAAANGHLDMVRFLLENGAEVNPGYNDYGWHPPLNAAARKGHLEIVNLLIDAGADLEAFTYAESANRPIHDALWGAYAHEGDTTKNIVKALIDAGADVNAPDGSQGITALSIACRNGNERIAEYLIEIGAEVKEGCVSSAANNRSHGLVELLVSKGGNINDKNGDALRQAAWYGDTEGIELYLNLGANPALTNDKGETALDIAKSRGHQEIVDALSKVIPR